MLLRHAEREALDDGEIGESCPLTPEGLRDARELGSRIAGWRIDRLYSSPVSRCVDTAKAIAGGAGIGGVEIAVRKELGDPRIYIKDMGLAEQAFKKYGNAGVVEQYVRNGGLEGFVTSAGRRLFMSGIYADIERAGSHNVYVSHDMLLIPMITHMTGERFGAGHWLDCLDGFIVTKLGDDIRAIRGGRSFPIIVE